MPVFTWQLEEKLASLKEEMKDAQRVAATVKKVSDPPMHTTHMHKKIFLRFIPDQRQAQGGGARGVAAVLSAAGSAGGVQEEGDAQPTTDRSSESREGQAQWRLIGMV